MTRAKDSRAPRTLRVPAALTLVLAGIAPAVAVSEYGGCSNRAPAVDASSSEDRQDARNADAGREDAAREDAGREDAGRDAPVDAGLDARADAHPDARPADAAVPADAPIDTPEV